MSLASVQAYYKGVLDGFHTSYMDARNVKPFNCFVAPPQVVTDTLEAPELYLWGGRDRVRRTTMPATSTFSGGFKRNEWELDVYMFFIDVAQPDDVVFPLILDGFRVALESVPQERQLTDAVTGQVTQLIRIADMFDLEYPPPTSIEDQSNLLYTAKATIRTLEDYQA